jgi:hypothetical protein
MPTVDMIGPSDMKVNRRRRAAASGVPVSAATWHLDAHGRRLRDEHERTVPRGVTAATAGFGAQEALHDGTDR